MGLAEATVLADDPGQMQIARAQDQTQFLASLTTSTDVRRLPDQRVELAPARAPAIAIWLLATLEQKNFVAFIETIKQGRDFVRSGHSFFAVVKPQTIQACSR